MFVFATIKRGRSGRVVQLVALVFGEDGIISRITGHADQVDDDMAQEDEGGDAACNPHRHRIWEVRKHEDEIGDGEEEDEEPGHSLQGMQWERPAVLSHTSSFGLLVA